MRQNISTYRNPYLILFSVLLFFTPLVFVTGTNELFEFPKMVFVYILGGFTIAFFLTDYILGNKPIKLLSKPVLLFLGVTVLSALFSSHVRTSLFGYYSRFNDSLLSTLVFFGLYIVGKNTLTKSMFNYLLKVILLTIIPLSIFGIFQHFKGTERVFSFFGQPNWLAQYLCMVLPLCIYFSVKESFKIWFLVYLIGFSCFWFTYSVSGFIGFLIGIALLIILLVKKDILERSTTTKLLVLLFFSILITSFNLGIFKEKIEDAFYDLKQQTVLIKKTYASENSHKVSDPGFIRFELWRSTLDLIFSTPKVFLIGTGLETYPYEFQPFRNNKLNYSSEWNYVFNKPHNYYLEIFSELGVFGLLSFLLLIIWLLKKMPYFLIPSLMAFLVTNFFGWPVVSTSLLFWFFLSLSETFEKEGVQRK